jgi:hypothetical protein
MRTLDIDQKIAAKVEKATIAIIIIIIIRRRRRRRRNVSTFCCLPSCMALKIIIVQNRARIEPFNL